MRWSKAVQISTTAVAVQDTEHTQGLVRESRHGAAR
jgi:hypothetical protein